MVVAGETTTILRQSRYVRQLVYNLNKCFMTDLTFGGFLIIMFVSANITA